MQDNAAVKTSNRLEHRLERTCIAREWKAVGRCCWIFDVEMIILVDAHHYEMRVPSAVANEQVLGPGRHLRHVHIVQNSN